MGPLIQRVLKVQTDSLEAGATVSALLHILAIAAVAINWWAWWARPMPPAGTSHGMQAMLLYMPGPPSPASQAAIRTAPVTRPKRKLAVLPTLAPPPSTPEQLPVAGIAQNKSAGSDARGNGTVSIVFIQPFPKEHPDLSKLPAGSSGDVILGLQIDNTGKVAGATAKHGLGYGIEEMLIAAVEQWTFHPAMKDGRPVASEQELRFHYHVTGDPLTAGWESFTLAE